MVKKEKSDILCPFCEKPLYFKRITIDSDYESAIIKMYWCRCRQYRQAVRLTDKFLKLKKDTFKKRDRMIRRFKRIVEGSYVRGYFVPSKKYATYNFLGLMDDRDMEMWGDALSRGGL